MAKIKIKIFVRGNHVRWTVIAPPKRIMGGKYIPTK